MNNRTLWTIVGVVLLVVIALLVFGVITIPVTEQVTTPATSTAAVSFRTAAPYLADGFKSAPAFAFAA